MRMFKANLTVNSKQRLSEEGQDYAAIKAIKEAMDTALGQEYWQKMRKAPVEGKKVSLRFDVTIECTMNRRAGRRAPDVIQAEKDARQARAVQRAFEQQEWAEQAKRQKILHRKRIVNQIDHAFKTGKSGSETAAMYITCDHCSAAAASLCLSRPVPPGATVLDESTIEGAVCKDHASYYGYGQYNPGYRQQQAANSISCARLEFFYDGVRQVAIKDGAK